jgi:hypothetical protein
MDGTPREDHGAPPGAIHEKLKRERAGRFSGDPDTQMGYDAASAADEPADRADGTPSLPGGDSEEKLARGGGGDETGVER